MPIVAIVDTNADPEGIDYVIPANDDAVGSIQYITHAIAQAYREGKELREKEVASANKANEARKTEEKPVEKIDDKPAEVTVVADKPAEKVVEKKKTGRPKKA